MLGGAGAKAIARQRVAASQLFAACTGSSEHLGAAIPGLVPADEVSLGSRAANLVSRNHQPVVEGLSSRLGGQIEVASLDDADVLRRSRLGNSRNGLDHRGARQCRKGNDLESLFHRSPPVRMRSLFSLDSQLT